MSKDLREALEHIWGGGIDYALSPDFKELTPDEKDALYIRYRDNLIEKAERLIAQDRQELLKRIEGLPDLIKEVTVSGVAVPRQEMDSITLQDLRLVLPAIINAIRESI